MTQQIVHSGERLDQAQARELTDRIRSGLTDLAPLVHAAHAGRAWQALGYESWEDYCAAEFVNQLPRLPRSERPGQVAALRESGMTIRAIAAGLGVSTQTVQRDLRPADVVNHHNDDEPAWPPGDVDTERLSDWLRVAAEVNVAPDLPLTEEAESWIESAFIQDSADIPIGLTVLLVLPMGKDDLEARIAGALISRMAMWRSVGIARKRVREKFTPWMEMVLSPSVRAEYAEDEFFRGFTQTMLHGPDGDLDRHEELIELMLDNIASIPQLPERLRAGGDRDE